MFYPGFPYVPCMQGQVAPTNPQQFCYFPPEFYYEYWKNSNKIIQKPQMVDVAVGTDSVPQTIINFSRVVKIQAQEQEQLENQQINRQECTVNKKRRKQSQKKNTETNIINQLLSFLISHEKSGAKLSILTDRCQKKQQIFYSLIKCLKRVKSKYLNRKYLMNLIFLNQGSEQIKLVESNNYLPQDLSVKEIRAILLRLSIYFLKTRSECCLIRSKRIKDNTRFTHLQKRRQLIKMILEEAQRINKQQFKEQQQQ